MGFLTTQASFIRFCGKSPLQLVLYRIKIKREFQLNIKESVSCKKLLQESPLQIKKTNDSSIRQTQPH